MPIPAVQWQDDMIHRDFPSHPVELCFWLFLLNSARSQQDWFRSLYFKTWVVGSVVAIMYMPLVAIFTRSDPLQVCSAIACVDLVVNGPTVERSIHFPGRKPWQPLPYPLVHPNPVRTLAHHAL